MYEHLLIVTIIIAERLLHLFVKDKEGRKALICDEGQ